MYVILMGAQGAGKGTQAERLAPALTCTTSRPAKLFRSAIQCADRTRLLAQGIPRPRRLVPDDVTLGIVADKLEEIADGAGPVQGRCALRRLSADRCPGRGARRSLEKRGERSRR